jgi:hypothetical protein
MFLASFHSPDVVFEQLSAIYAIARYACRALKVCADGVSLLFG